MRTCNVCGKEKKSSKFKHGNKKTCLKCETRWWQRILRYLAYRRSLSPYEKFASRVGYLGTGFLISAQWTLEPVLYILGFICVAVQTSSRRQWNLVALNMNGLIAWIRHLVG
ncbi:hypothetical protein OAA23_00515 [bacterium]|nr:hypothetical protein [bacterium]